MLRTVAVLLVVILGLAVSAGALEIVLGPIGGYSTFRHVNVLIDGYSESSAILLPNLHTSLGLYGDVGLWSPVNRMTVGMGALAMGAQTSERNASVRTSLLGVYLWTGYELGRLQASLALGGLRGTFVSEVLIPYGQLTGIDAGLIGRVSYRGLRLGALELGGTVALQWLPVGEMKDGRGQLYRGRGTPFMDFSGISVSMDVRWQSRKGVTP